MSNPPLDQETIDELAARVTLGQVVLSPTTTILIMYLVYGLCIFEEEPSFMKLNLLQGLYIPLFGCAFFILYRQGFENKKLYMTCTIALFIISTGLVITDTIFTIDIAKRQFNALKNQDWEPYFHYLVRHKGKTATIAIFCFLLPPANIFAEIMLIHRCYVIWGNAKRVGIPLLVASALGSLISLIGSILVTYGISQDTSIEHNVFLVAVGDQLFLIGFSLSAFINITATGLTAGRIWWANREARIYLGVSRDSHLQHTIKIIIESGLLYPVMMIIQAIIANTGDPEDPTQAGVDLVSVVVLSAAIAPALIVVRAHFDRTRPNSTAPSDKRVPELTNMQFASPEVHVITRKTASRSNTGSTMASTTYHLKSISEPERQKVRSSEAAVPLLSVPEHAPDDVPEDISETTSTIL